MQGRAHSLSAVFRLLAAFSVLSVIAGILMAAVAMPAIGAVGSVANSSVDFFNDLPHDFTATPLAQQSKILDSEGGLVANPYDENRIVVGLKSISPWMQKAQIALEDARFYEHNGLDTKGLARAFVSQLTGGQVQGASSITQQYVKLTLQDNALRRGDKAAAQDAVEVSFGRKLQELRYALDVEEKLTKQQILTNYLNLAYYGDQAYGVEAAAINYFSIRAKDLNIGQAALLAGIVQQPTTFNPLINAKKSQERRDLVLDRMQALGMATPDQVKAAKATPVGKMIHKTYTPGGCHRSKVPYLCSYVMKWLENAPEMAVLGKTPTERLKNINQSGLTIRTSFNPKIQAAAQKYVSATIKPNDPLLGAAAAIVEPGTGRVLALAQSSDFKKLEVNWNVQQDYGGVTNGFQFGSTAKMFTLVTALEKGMSINATGLSPGADKGKYHVFKPEDFHDECNASSPYEVDVHGHKASTMSLRTATAQSDNGFYVNLAIKVGGCQVWETMKKMGMARGNGDPITKSIAPVSLGVDDVTPLTLANAYATLAANGKYCSPIPVTSITTPDRKEIKFKTTNCKQVIREDVAAGATQLLRGVLRPGGTASESGWSQSRPAAGKTGTTTGNGQVWFAGYTPQMSTAVWVGHPKNIYYPGTTTVRSLNGHCFGRYGSCNRPIFGGTITAPLWADIMRDAHEGLPVKSFPEPGSAVVNGDYVSLPWVVGRDYASAKAILNAAGFEVFQAGTMNSGYPKGVVAATDPSGQAIRDSSVGLVLSTGVSPKPTASPSKSGSAKPSTKPSTKPTKKK